MKVKPPFFNKLIISCTSGIFLLGTYAHHVHTVNAAEIKAAAEEEIACVLENIPKPQDDDCYLFIRLYSPVYKKTFSSTNFLRYCISKTDVSDYHVSHASIGFSLKDDFFSLTQTGASCVKVEHCTDISTNPYMDTCDAEKSQQIVFAVKVTREEYDRAIELIRNSSNLSYSVLQNFVIAQYCVERKYLTAEDEQGLDEFYRTHAKKSKQKKKLFVCSTFVAYILDNSVDRIHDFFVEKGIDYHFLTVADLAEIPGVRPLFSSSWEDYNRAAEEFASSDENFLM